MVFLGKLRNVDPRIRSLFIVHTSMLIFSMGNSIIVTGIWPYLQALDPSVTLDEYGIVVASDALAQIIIAPILGAVADRMGSIRLVSMLCSLIFCAGNIFYSAISLVPRNGDIKAARYIAMIVARFLVGIGTANIAPNRLYVAKATKPSERMTHISLLSLFQTLGFVLGPGMQAALSPIGEKSEIPENSTLHVDMYAACGYVGAITGILSFIMFLPGIFTEYTIDDGKNGKTKIEQAPRQESLTNPKDLVREFSTVSFTGPPPLSTRKSEAMLAINKEPVVEEKGKSFWESEKPEWLPTITCWYLIFAALVNYTMAETIQTPLAMDQWAWTRQEAVRYLGINMACGALVGVTCFGCIGPLAKKFDDRKLLIFVGLIPLIIGKIVLIPMGSDKPLYIDPTDQTHVYAAGNCETWNNKTLQFISPNYPNNYPSDTHCYWTFISEEEERVIEIHIDEMSLDSVNNKDCENDYIEVTEMSGGVITKSANYCDSIPGIPFRSNGRSVDVAFHSDGAYEDSGFQISYRAIDLRFGCRLAWCDTIPKIEMAQFFVGAYITLVGYPFVVALTSGIYSRVLGNIPQGFWMGIFTTCGGLSRVIGPIGTSSLYQHYGTYAVYFSIIGILVLALIMAIISFKRFKVRPQIPPELSTSMAKDRNASVSSNEKY